MNLFLIAGTLISLPQVVNESGAIVHLTDHDLGPLQQPCCVCADGLGNVVVGDVGGQRLVAVREDGSALGAWPTPAPPCGVLVRRDGRVVASLADGSIAVW